MFSVNSVSVLIPLSYAYCQFISGYIQANCKCSLSLCLVVPAVLRFMAKLELFLYMFTSAT